MKFIKYLFLSIWLMLLISVTTAWWNNSSTNWLLQHYGYNFDGMNSREIYGDVKPEHRVIVQELVRSVNGVGWPLKAFFYFVMLFPYFIFIYILNIFVRKMKNGIKS